MEFDKGCPADQIGIKQERPDKIMTNTARMDLGVYKIIGIELDFRYWLRPEDAQGAIYVSYESQE